jgi:hypothetical protein
MTTNIARLAIWMFFVSGLSAQPFASPAALSALAPESPPTLLVRSAPALSLTVRPTVALAPATAIVVVTLERDDSNRALEIEADSGKYFTSSYRQLDGAADARTHQFFLKDLPAGFYQVRVVIYGVGGKIRHMDKEPLEVRP